MTRPNLSLSLSRPCVVLAIVASLLAAGDAFPDNVGTITVLNSGVTPYYFSPPVRGTCTFTAQINVPFDIPGVVRGNSPNHAQDGSQLVLSMVVDLLDPSGGVIREVTSDQVIQPLSRAPGGGQHSTVVSGTATWDGHLANGALAPDAIYSFRLSAVLNKAQQNPNAAPGSRAAQPQVTLLAQTAAPAQGTVLLDSTPPVVTINYPAAYALLRSGSLTVQASYTDNLAGVDPSTAQAAVNAVDLTSFATVGANALSLPLQGRLSLPDGPSSARVAVKDRAGNVGSAAVQFLVDTVPPTVQLGPADGTTITSLPVTFTVTVQDNGSGLSDSPASIKFNGQDVTGRFQTQVPTRFPVLNAQNVAQEVDYSYTPSMTEFVALVMASGNGTLLMEVVDGQDRALNRTHVTASYPVNLSSGTQAPPVIALRDAGGVPNHGPAVTNRCDPRGVYIRAVDLARGGAGVPSVALTFESPQDWGFFVTTGTGLSDVTDGNGYAAARFVAGPTAGQFPVQVSVTGDSTVMPLQLTESATEPTFSLVGDYARQAEPGSCVSGGIDVGVGTGGAYLPVSGPYLGGETVTIVMLDADGRETPVDESQFLVLPAEALTDPLGRAHFELIVLPATSPGTYNFRARLVEWQDGANFSLTVLDPSATTIIAPTPPAEGWWYGSGWSKRNISLSVVSGNGQIGVHDAALQRQLVVQLMKDGQPTGPISESYTLDGMPFQFYVRKVGFALGGNAILNAPSDHPQSAEVDLDENGRAGVTLTCGPSTAPIEVAAEVIMEYGFDPYLLESSSEPSPIPGAIFATGTPEDRLVHQLGDGLYEPVPFVPYVRHLFNTDYTHASFPSSDIVYAEHRAPSGSADATIVEPITSLDVCGNPFVAPQAIALGSRDIELKLDSNNPSPERCSVYRSSPIVFTTDTIAGHIATLPDQFPFAQLATGELLVQSSPYGHTKFGSGTTKKSGLEFGFFLDAKTDLLADSASIPNPEGLIKDSEGNYQVEVRSTDEGAKAAALGAVDWQVSNAGSGARLAPNGANAVVHAGGTEGTATLAVKATVNGVDLQDTLAVEIVHPLELKYRFITTNCAADTVKIDDEGISKRLKGATVILKQAGVLVTEETRFSIEVPVKALTLEMNPAQTPLDTLLRAQNRLLAPPLPNNGGPTPLPANGVPVNFIIDYWGRLQGEGVAGWTNAAANPDALALAPLNGIDGPMLTIQTFGKNTKPDDGAAITVLVWVNDTFSPRILAHETGHYLGLRHQGALVNQADTGHDGTNTELGNLMGDPAAMNFGDVSKNPPQHLRRDQILILRKSEVFNGQ